MCEDGYRVPLSVLALSAKIIYTYYRGSLRKSFLDPFHGRHLKEIGHGTGCGFLRQTGRIRYCP